MIISLRSILSHFFYFVIGLLATIPLEVLAQSEGELWGTTTHGGTFDLGVIFKTAPDGTGWEVKYNFTQENYTPRGGLILGSDGLFYGITSGGSQGPALFSINPTTGEFLPKYNFKLNDGYNPRSSLLEGSNGNLYATTYLGGAQDYGVLFEYKLETGDYQKRFEFAGQDGSYPIASLMQASDGKIYGSTLFGGIGYGVLFSFDPITSTYEKLIDFDGIKGASPYCKLVEAVPGKLYGTAIDGDPGFSTLFEYNIAARTLVKKYDFDFDSGFDIYGLVQAANMKLYGLASRGGIHDLGTIVEYDVTSNTLIKKLEFTGQNGSSPKGTMVQASNGNLYGVTYSGGINNGGVLFEYNPLTNQLTKKFDLKAETGVKPEYMQLVEYKKPVIVTGLAKRDEVIQLRISPLPAHDKVSLGLSDPLLSGTGNLIITDVLGRVIQNIFGAVNQFNEIDIAFLSQGLYFVKLNINNKTLMGRLMKE